MKCVRRDPHRKVGGFVLHITNFMYEIYVISNYNVVY
nr:MAG TPA: hypothetical protein [Caudoviricetes sp.]DAP34995.1 MAG TPA: hypothetical protein [Caudoviricetes sp.]DAP87613.1 MAG TPA: hypothetical protein [Caudoviricetes sp.]DAY02684.1 MAG TPA: hypothetical protein [Caudoviricetes sp.]